MLSKLKQFMWLLPLIFSMQAAYADAGLPMIILVMPAMIVLLIPIITIEAIVLVKYLKLKYSRAFLSAGIGNIVSTIIGVPLTWGVMLSLELLTVGDKGYGTLISVTLQAPWMAPDENWMIPAAMAFLMIPFFFVSWIIEGFFVKITIDQSLRVHAYRASFYANLASYIFLEFIIFLFFIKSIIGG